MQTAHIRDQLTGTNLHLEKVTGQTASLQNSKKIYKPPEEDKRIVALKYAAPQIGSMSDQQVKHWSMALLLKVHVITGWVIPDSELMNILVDQFEKKLIEDYGTLNTEEIEYAFRKGGTIVKDWGKGMNLSLIDQVLSPYVNTRLQVSADEERLKTSPPPQKIYSDEEILNQRRGHIEQAFQAMKKGYYPTLHDYFLEVLQLDELIGIEETLADFFVRKLGNHAINIYVKENS